MRLSFEITRQKGEQRTDYPQSSISNFIKWLTEGFWGGSKALSGEQVDQETALKFSAVYACIRVLGETMASIPKHVIKLEDGKKFPATDHKIYDLVHSEPNPLMSAFTFYETLMAHAVGWGNAYAEIKRGGDHVPKELIPIHPGLVEPKLFKNGRLRYEVKKADGQTKDRDIQAVNMIHVPGLSYNGIIGQSPIDIAADSIGLGLAMQRWSSEFFKNGASLTGVFEHPGKLSDKAYKHLSESLKEKTTGQGNRHGVQILEEGMKYAQKAIPPEAAQFIQSRKFQINEIARIFRVPPHMIADLERSTNNNIEHQGIEFVTYTMLPWCMRFEQEFNRKLFKESERGRMFVKCNLNGLLRGDAKSRAEYFEIMTRIGVYSINEVRELEDKNEIGPEGDSRLVMVNMAPLEQVQKQNINTDE